MMEGVWLEQVEREPELEGTSQGQRIMTFMRRVEKDIFSATQELPSLLGIIYGSARLEVK
jgi:hypothetical protein